MKLVLASASPRRAELLRQVGIPFKIIKPGIEEKPDYTLPPGDMVKGLAREKALVVARKINKGVIIAADTLVLHRGEALGKPTDPEEAGRMLRRLSGDVHEVITGLTLLDTSSGKDESGISMTRVWMKALSDDDIEAYVSSGEPLDKAGAYGIQGRAALYVEKIEGCYFNVVGLPLSLFFDLMQRMQIKIRYEP